MKKARKIKDIEAEEISLVDKSANRRKFFITKHGRIVMEELIKILKTIFGEDAISDDQIKKIQALPEEQATMLKGALEKIGSYEDVDYPEEYEGAFNDIVKLAAFEYPALESADDSILDLEKAGKALSKATLAQLRKIADIVKGLIGEKEETLKGDDEEKLSDATLAKLEKLTELEKAAAEALKKTEEDEKKALADKVEELTRTVEELGKKKPVKKGLEGQDGIKKGGEEEEEEEEENTNKWGSLTSASADE